MTAHGPVRLLRPGSVVGRLGGALIPADLYPVTRDPAIFGLSYPARIDWELLAGVGVGTIVCLTHDEAPYDPAPLTCHAIRLDDLYHGDPPLDPADQEARARRAANVVVDAVRAQTGVAVHCHAGRGRTGTVIGIALVVLGHEPERVIEYLDRVQSERGKPGWPESDWQADVVRRALSSRGPT